MTTVRPSRLPRTRVLMSADAVGGVWTYALDVASALAPYRVEVHLATMGRRPSALQLADARAAGVAEVHQSDHALEWMDDPWDEVDAAGAWLLDVAAEVGPDVVHLNGFAHATLPWTVPVVVAGHSCVLSWWAAVRGGEAPASYDEYRRRVSRGLAAADVVVAPSSAMLAELQRWYGLRGGLVIHNGRRVPRLPAVPKQHLVLGTGRVWDEAKNLVALERLAGRLPWPTVIAGDVAHPSGGSPWQARQAVALGHVPPDRLNEWLARASIFVHPARYEPFGLGPLEAGLAGCALVLGDIPSLREVWEDDAIFVEPGDDDALLRTCLELIADPALLDRWARRARRRAGDYDLATTGHAYATVYHRSIRARTEVGA